MKQYKHILFDLDDTILDFQDTEEKALAKVIAQFKLPDTKETVDCYKRINRSLWVNLEQGTISREQLFSTRFSLFLKEFDITEDGEKVEKLYRTNLGEGIKMIDNAKDVLSALLSEGYHLHAATNGAAVTQRKRLAGADLLSFFDGIFISEELGYEKPDERFFQHIFHDLKTINKKDYLMVGDSLTSDIQGAVNAGIDSVWFNLRKAPVNASGARSTYTISALPELLDIAGVTNTIKEETHAGSSLISE